MSLSELLKCVIAKKQRFTVKNVFLIFSVSYL